MLLLFWNGVENEPPEVMAEPHAWWTSPVARAGFSARRQRSGYTATTEPGGFTGKTSKASFTAKAKKPSWTGADE